MDTTTVEKRYGGFVTDPDTAFDSLDQRCVYVGIILPDDLTMIEDEAFAGVQAHKVEIGATVTSIGCRAFADIEGILYADFANSSNIEIHDRAFENTNAVFLCYENSAAYYYATEKNIPYTLKQAVSPR